MDAIKLLLTPPGTQTKFTDTRVTPALKSEKYLTLILMRNIFHSLRFEFLVPRNTEEIRIQEMKETKELDIQSRMLNA